ncbi:hypothetical protein FRC01_002953 [Tulasnella sp. 417]|nr:hypothetical protein FRC01_002953 [Tulasnella sp. 417]
MVASAYERYLDTSPDGKELAKDFKEQLGQPCPIEFLGLWDTVSSVGIVTSRHLPFSASNSAVKTVRHALALDERRTKFRHNPWYGTARERSLDPPSFLREVISVIVEPIPILSSLFALPPRPEDIHAVDDETQGRMTDVKEVWFAGCHSDVGGGHGDPSTSNTISDPSLCWMINQVLLSKVPIRFSIEALTKLRGFRYVPANPLPTPPKGNHPDESTRHFIFNLQRVEQQDAGLNATSLIHDELKSNWFWWVPECLLFRNSVLDRDGNRWRETRFPNFGWGRKIWESTVLVHESVQMRLKGKSYQPMATFGRKNPHVQFVDDSGANMGEGSVVKGRLVRDKVRGANRLRSSDQLRLEVPPQRSRRRLWLSIAAACVAIPLGLYATCGTGALKLLSFML